MNELPWFRLYNSFLTNDRIQMLAFEDRAHYVALLCLKNRGSLDKFKEDRDIQLISVAKALGLDPLSADEAKFRLMKVGLITDDWEPLGWNEKQFVSDNASARVRKHRAQKQSKKQGLKSVKRNGNVTVTVPETDTESDTETEREERHFAPPDFRVSKEAQEIATENGLSSTEVRQEHRKFLLYEFDKSIGDWERRFLRWLLDAVEHKRKYAKAEQPTPAYWTKR